MQPRPPILILLLIPSLAMIAGGGGCSSARSTSADSSQAAALAVSNTYLASACGELLDEGAPLQVLAPAGSCPGHFDVRPSQARAMRSCRVMIRFDFQRGLDDKVRTWAGDQLTIASVTVPGGLVEPATYRAICRQAADVLTRHALLDPAVAEDRLAKVEQAVADLQAEIDERIALAGLAGAPVLAAGHQAAFCRSLGFDVVATFAGADQSAIGQVDQAIRRADARKVRLVIANRPEGRQLADALADRLGARVVVFGNFPDPSEGNYAGLVRANLARLVGNGDVPTGAR